MPCTCLREDVLLAGADANAAQSTVAAPLAAPRSLALRQLPGRREQALGRVTVLMRTCSGSLTGSVQYQRPPMRDPESPAAYPGRQPEAASLPAGGAIDGGPGFLRVRRAAAQARDPPNWRSGIRTVPRATTATGIASTSSSMTRTSPAPPPSSESPSGRSGRTARGQTWTAKCPRPRSHWHWHATGRC